MASDGIVTSRLVLRALTQTQRRRARYVMEQLEQQEPELAEFVFEQLSDLHQRLWAAGCSDAQARRLYRRIEVLVLTAITALRQAHAELWDRHGDPAPDEARKQDDKPASD